MPVVATLEDLDENSLKKILTDPKNALVSSTSGCSRWRTSS